ncbi:hypothetical protein F2Q69_00002529 [Brassica cretica]|uniref:Uncharacterized protein n=1 Tax=Brassica cretica TaxID=69181 RepID=A0A8S9PL81_BRACR|nr:hypothetical protein F2Q69_00002529 [Brassica cretica]
MLIHARSVSLGAAAIDNFNQAPYNTVHSVPNDTVYPNTVYPDTVHPGTVHPGTVHLGTVHAAPNGMKTEKIKVLILSFDENGILRDEEGRTRNSA